jgi:hypothetical protein
MSIEYHKVVKHYGNSNFQAFVFRYDRDTVDQSIGLVDIWVFTKHNDCVSKLRLDMDKLSEQVYHQPQYTKMSENDVDDLYKVFDNILEESNKEDRLIEKLEHEVDNQVLDLTDTLIRAAEAAISAHPVLSLEEMAKNYENSKHNK